MPVLFSVLVIALSIGALIDAIVISEDRVRYLPKVAWVILIVLVPLVGSIFWFALGREYRRAPAPWREYTDKGALPGSAPARPRDTRSTEQQLADLDMEIEEWRLRAEIEKRKRDQGEGSVG
ncbi:MAG: hypothetical protein BGO47_10585 [Microbacterium sp. 67-17]|jgi:hypothetical protein|uniref:PLD nuclease N-terminal domain-containing protein n=1 Tax=Microbacterium sp. 67-17 TaxID=1895782 RepID=UPI000966401A|nr:PLD nuclease N-terminal domain-containing protein [Microbacterium sp. 67-17]OJV97292.1 MAG: hypothetical protein BGO47_10585 [Microbacterium sp. 67-17]